MTVSDRTAEAINRSAMTVRFLGGFRYGGHDRMAVCADGDLVSWW